MKNAKKIVLFIILILAACALGACKSKDSQGAHNVFFVTDGGSAVETMTAEVLETAPVSTKNEYRLSGWYLKEDFSVKAAFPFTVTKDTTLYAKWDKTYRITYIVDSVAYEAYDYKEGEAIATLAEPMRDGYNFSGWLDEIPQTMPAERLEIHGNFSPKTYYICFKAESGVTISGTTGTYTTQDDAKETYPCIAVTYGSAYNNRLVNITATKEDYDFDCWTYYDLTDHIRKDYKVSATWTSTGNVLLTPKWGQVGTVGLEYTLNESKDGYIVSKYARNNQRVIVPAQYNSLPVVGIGAEAFMPDISLNQISQIVSVTLPSSIQTIGQGAFRSCTNLREINIPNYVTSIGASAFSNCTSLTTITLSNNLKALPDNLFADCALLEEVVLPAHLEKIGHSAFANAEKLTKVNIPSSVYSLGKFAFENCKALRTLSIVNTKITEIGTGAFKGCLALESMTLPSTVTVIGAGAFQTCETMTRVDIPDSVRSIEASAFEGCIRLMSVTITKETVSIQARAFFGCTNLTYIRVQLTASESEPNGWEADWRLKSRDVVSGKTEYHELNRIGV